MANLKNENNLLLKYAQQFYQSQFSSIQTDPFMQEGGILSNLNLLQKAAQEALEYV